MMENRTVSNFRNELEFSYSDATFEFFIFHSIMYILILFSYSRQKQRFQAETGRMWDQLIFSSTICSFSRTYSKYITKLQKYLLSTHNHPTATRY